MTDRGTGAQDFPATVRVRAEGGVGEEALAYVRTKVGVVLGRPGLPAVSGEVRIAKAAAHHAEQPWSAAAEIRVGNVLVVVHAREASARELADRLQDRLRSQTERVLHRRDAAHRSPTPPPWRGGRTDGQPGQGTPALSGEADRPTPQGVSARMPQGGRARG